MHTSSKFNVVENADEILYELDRIDNWKIFKRNNSSFLETYQWKSKPIDDLISHYRSPSFISKLEKTTNTNSLLIDPHGVGEGISCMREGDLMDPHIDFNWNDSCKLSRKLNVLIYFSKNCEGGELQFFNESRSNVIFRHTPTNNSCIIFEHSEKNAHGVTKITNGIRYAFRLFYYQDLGVEQNPHQSLYWFEDGKSFNPKKHMKTNSQDYGRERLLRTS